MPAAVSFYVCSENYSMIYPLSSNFYFLKRQERNLSPSALIVFSIFQIGQRVYLFDKEKVRCFVDDRSTANQVQCDIPYSLHNSG